MTTNDGLTRLLDTWLAEEGTPTTPGYLDEVLVRTSAARQRPAWLSPGRWLPVDTTTINPRAYSIPPVARYVLIAALLIALAAAGIALVASSQHRRAAPLLGPAANGRIYFDSAGAIVSANDDGSARQTLDLGLANAASPDLGPDGTTFAFSTSNPLMVADTAMWVADSEGSHVRRISGDLHLDIDPTINPTWSPDSTKLAFGAYDPATATDRLYVANADGSGVRPLGEPPTGPLGQPHHWRNPEWSSSGEWIAFGDEDPGVDHALAIIHPDGTGYRRLPISPMAGEGFRGFQLWAPDQSNRVLYALGSHDDFQGSAIAMFDVDTGVETILSQDPGVEQHRAAWSPDAKRIAFHLGGEMAVMNADGSNRKVINGALGPQLTGWSPDGTRIYGRSDDGRTIISLDVDGSSPVTTLPVGDQAATFFTWQRLAP